MYLNVKYSTCLFRLLHSTWVTLMSYKRLTLVVAPEKVKARVAVSPEFAPMSTYTTQKTTMKLGTIQLYLFLLCCPEFSPQMVGIICPVATWNIYKKYSLNVFY